MLDPHIAACRYPREESEVVVFEGEQIEQNGTQPEHRCRDANEGECRQDVIDPAPLEDTGYDAEQDPEEEPDDTCTDRDRECPWYPRARSLARPRSGSDTR